MAGRLRPPAPGAGAELIAAGKLRPLLGRTYPLAEVPEAIRYLVEGHGRGKVVIAVTALEAGR